jgi:hypothetical protein
MLVYVECGILIDTENVYSKIHVPLRHLKRLKNNLGVPTAPMMTRVSFVLVMIIKVISVYGSVVLTHSIVFNYKSRNHSL